ncbi:MAG TPA: FAD-dependent monooxygenase [Geminicoccaceae bacterium]|nr:FAD-dependent monooxygenase [Geminicoccus sp.]HMU49181.1 FAD-dependent monooxygenase [Geminicoccaceae bacterium]
MGDVDVVIVGAGHAGLWLGGGLARAGLAVRVVDPDSPDAVDDASDGRTLALLGGSRGVAERMGLWRALAPIAQPVTRVEVRDAGSGSSVLYSPAELGVATFAWGVENRPLRRALAADFLAVAGADAWVTGRVAGLRRGTDAVSILLDDGRTLEAPLAIGADGRASRLRQLLRIPVDRLGYGQAAIALVVAHDRPHGEAVRERLRPSGPLALLPLTGRRCGVTWVEPEAEARRLAGLPPRDLLSALDAGIGGVLGELALASPVAVWPLGAQHARRYVAPRVALVGDAAHGVHPIHAQGFNMGVADIGVLFDLLAGARARGRDLGDPGLLLAYERARWWDNERRLRLTDGLNRLFSNDVAPAKALRGAMLRALDSIPPLKALAVRQGMRAG